MKGTIISNLDERPFPNPIEDHTADSKWQYCNCRSCQGKRRMMESLPGTKLDFDKIRLKDEKY